MPNFATSGMLGVDFTATSTKAQHALGTQVQGNNGSVWIYVKFGGTVAIYDYVCIDELFSALAGTKANVDAGHQVGFSQLAAVSGDYGWVPLQGRGTIKSNLLANCAADVALYTTATAGKLDDDSTSQTLISGVVAAAAVVAAGPAEIIATYPRGK